MIDVVYVNRDGENPELRYSLRSLKNVTHDLVWVFGGAPVWLNTEQVHCRQRVQKASPYMSTRAHIAAACNDGDVSDPFMLWNDDFFAMKMIGNVTPMHRGPLSDLMERFTKIKTPWANGMREADAILRAEGVKDPVSYDTHHPLIVHKCDMLLTLDRIANAKVDAIHLRTVYGNLAKLGGVEAPEPKLMRRTDPFPRGPWLSSGDGTYRSTIEPVLRYTFPDPCFYEKGLA